MATAIGTNVPVKLEAIGHAVPFSSIAIRSQASGLLESVHFKEGELVKTGQLMFSINSRLLSAALARAKGDLARDSGLQAHAKIEQDENAALLQNRIVSKDSFNESVANADSLKATVESDKAAVDLAELELSYCQIHSAVNGRAGFLQINPGSIIPGPEMVLVTVNQTQPILVDFPIPEASLPAIREGLNHGPVVVQAAAEGQQTRWSGTLLAMDNAVDENTHTILLRARFANEKEELWPGQSVNIVLKTASTAPAAMVPDTALQKGPAGEFVFVVRRDETIEARAVEPGEQLAGELVICSGIQPGERVVLGPPHHLAPGQKVRVVKPGPPQDPGPRTHCGP